MSHHAAMPNLGLKYNWFLPFYNWIYPIGGQASETHTGRTAEEVFGRISPAQSRALYVHVPFCDTICTFCPFVRAAEHDREVISEYVDALVKEIRLKGEIPQLTSTPIGAVFFGGGTPSFLTPD